MAGLGGGTAWWGPAGVGPQATAAADDDASMNPATLAASVNIYLL